MTKQSLLPLLFLPLLFFIFSPRALASEETTPPVVDSIAPPARPAGGLQNDSSVTEPEIPALRANLAMSS